MEEIYIKIGVRLRKRRTELKMSLSKLAGLLGVSRATLGYYESGERRIPVHHLAALEKILSKPLHYYQNNLPEYEVLEQRFISLLDVVVEGARYLPITGYSTQKNFEVMDFETKRMLPFPEQIVGGIDFAYGMGSIDKMKVYLVSKSEQPRPGDLVFTEISDHNREAKQTEKFYAVESYDEIIKVWSQYKKAGIKKKEDQIIGVVKGVLQMGEFGKLTTVDYIEV